MQSDTLGKNTSEVEVTNVSPHGFWLLLEGVEFFLPFASSPWFRNATVGAIFNVKTPHLGYLHWPGLDVDLELESIEYPERFPLIA